MDVSDAVLLLFNKLTFTVRVSPLLSLLMPSSGLSSSSASSDIIGRRIGIKPCAIAVAAAAAFCAFEILSRISTLDSFSRPHGRSHMNCAYP